jgi:hypothetical protein
MRSILLLAGLLGLMAGFAYGEARTASVKVSYTERLGPLEIDRMALGQGGLSEEPMWDSRVAEIRALRPKVIRLFIQEYFDLLPELGRYHFTTLDRSIETIRKTGAEPLMCICFKPRVFFPQVNQDVVEPNDYEEWECLIYATVKHYRDAGAGIRYWEVANEPDIGESGGCPYRFQPASYVRYYQRTVAAIRRADPEARVGGPALAYVRSPILPALLDYCEKEKVPLDFVSWHIYSSDPAQVRGTIDYAKDLLKKHPGLKPETILDEWNMDLMNPPLDRRFQPCYVLETIWQMKDAGLDGACYYHIRDWHVRPERFAPFMSSQGTAFMTKWWNRMPQFDGLFDFQDNVRPAYFAFKLLARLTGDRLRLASNDAKVRGFATHDEAFQVSSLLVWNFSEAPVEVELTVDGLPKSMRVRHIVLDALAPSDDENARLRPDPPAELKAGTNRLQVQFDPYAIHFWSLE